MVLVPPYRVAFAYVPPSFYAIHGVHSGSALGHHGEPVRWFLECCKRRSDLPAFSFAGDAPDRRRLTFAVDAVDEDPGAHVPLTTAFDLPFSE